jgi:hypothetical protein
MPTGVIYYPSTGQPVSTMTVNRDQTISYSYSGTTSFLAAAFVFSNYIEDANNGVTVGPAGPTSTNPITYWTNDPTNSYANNASVNYNIVDNETTYSTSFYFPSYSTTMSDNNTITYDPSQPTYLKFYVVQPNFQIVLASQILITIDFVCFKEDTKILTDKGYVCIQDLRKGDLVKTLFNDFKSVEMIGKRDISHNALETRIKNQLYTCSKENYPELLEDLVLTGCHSILIDNFVSEEQKNKVVDLIGDIYVTSGKYRLPVCLDDKSSVYDKKGTHTIYNLALENDNYYMNYGIYANGLLVESCSKRYLKELSGMTLIE